MKSYEERLPRRGTAPRNIVRVNQLLVSNVLTKQDVAAQIGEGPLDDSWCGVRGPLNELAQRKNLRTTVSGQKVVSIIRPRPGFLRGINACPDELVEEVSGWLGNLAVVDVDSSLQTWATKRLSDVGATSVIAAEIHHAPDEGLVSYAAVSVPWGSYSGARHNPATFSIAKQ
ncbi:MAG TPA: hypothetical protein VHB51_02320 [Candidatus Saccharimonadales bacterium]|nr:hypothetical protein [Candidatus Saccharimonadales bacterium]